MIIINWLSTKDYVRTLENYHEGWEKEGNTKHLEFQDIKLFEKWCEENNITKWLNESINWTYVDARLARYNPNVVMPYEDHKAVFRNDKNENVFIIQPYYWDIEEIVLWAKSRGITVKVNPKYSWHFPNHTNLIELRVKDRETFRGAVKDIKDLTR